MPSFALLWLLTACTPATTPEVAAPSADTPLRVVALSQPVAWLAERVGGTDVEVELPPGLRGDPASTQPDGALVASLAEAELIVANGAGYEAWMATAALPEDRLVLASADIPLRSLEGGTHSHGSQGRHSHVGEDPHTWLDPVLMGQEASTLGRAMVERRPELEPAVIARVDELGAELLQVWEAWSALAPELRYRSMASTHPSYGYLAQRLDIELKSFSFDPAEVPEAADLAAFTEWARFQADGRDSTNPVVLLWWESPPSPEVEAAFPEGIVHVWVDALEQPVEGAPYDYLAQSRASLARLTEALAVTP